LDFELGGVAVFGLTPRPENASSVWCVLPIVTIPYFFAIL
jgi:hypothetical protein